MAGGRRQVQGTALPATEDARVHKRVRALVYAAATSAVVLLFALCEWWTEKFIADHSRLAGTAIEIGLVLAGTLAFRPIHERVDAAVEAAFTKRRREALECIAAFRHELTSFNDVQQLLRRLVEAVDKHGSSSATAVYLRRESYRAEASSFDAFAPEIEVDDGVVVRLRSASGPAKPQLLQSRAPGSIAFSMMVAGELVGLVAVEERYDDSDPEILHALGLLAESAGVALAALDPQLIRRERETPGNLRIGMQPLIGRDNELREIKALLEQSRLVTLTGSGGVGKTRTALHIAAELTCVPGGVWFVDFAPIQDAALVASAIAEVFGIPDEGGAGRLVDRIVNRLKNQHVVALLDNCEHLASAVAAVVDRLLSLCPRVQVLATSREPLGISGEEAYRLPALSVPPDGVPLDAERALEYSAVALFVARAHSAQRTFALTDSNAPIVADIVRRLDGIALAIELAAPKLIVLTAEQIVQRLDQRLKLLSGGSRTGRPAHQTLGAMIAWSYDLLDENEKRLLRRSGIFRGGWTLEDAEAICGDDLGSASVLDLMAALVDKSLIAVNEDDGVQRYRLLESTREFALARLDEVGERGAIASAHASYFATLSERALESYWILDSDLWTSHVRANLENYRAAITWGLEEGDAIAAVTIVGNLRPFWYKTARGEGNALLHLVKQLDIDDAAAVVRGRLALLEAFLENSGQAAKPAALAATLLTGTDELGRLEALTMQGTALGRAGHLDDAIPIFRALLPAARSSQRPSLTGWVLSLIAYWLGAAGDRDHARELFEEAAEILRVCNDRWQLARMQVNRAEFLFAEGDVTGAIASVREAQEVFRERNSDSGLCIATLNYAAYLLDVRRFEEAREAARAGLRIAERSGMPLATAVTHLARLAAHDRDAQRAAKLIGFADAALQATGSEREPTDQRVYRATLERLHAMLPADKIARLMDEGAGMATELAVIEALAEVPPDAAAIPS